MAHMSSAYLWVKAFHIVFVASWFAGLFYLPRIFVNLAMPSAADSHAERERLLLMAPQAVRLHRPADGAGAGAGPGILWLGYGIGLGPGSGWMHAKLALVVGAIGYQHILPGDPEEVRGLENRRSERWFRVFNEVTVLLFAATVVLVVVKPF